MKKILFLVLLFFCYTINLADATTTTSTQQNRVFVVMSKSAVAYHSTVQCRAVKNAKHPVKEVSLEEAKKMGRKPCGICCK